jgi:LysM repeat protein
MRPLAWLSVAFALQVICPTVAVQARSSTHVVQDGQKLASIAKRYGLTLSELCSANGLKKNAKIRPGLRLTIPEPGTEPDSDSPDKRESAGAIRDHSTSSSWVTASYHPGATSNIAHYEGVPKRKGLVRIIGYHGDWQGQLVDHRSRLVAKSATAVSRILAWPHKDFRMNERLLMLMAQVSDHFGGRPLRVVSGYRTTSWVEESKHPLGRACDFVVLGVPNKVLRDYLRSLESVGVGYYPNSTFVHMDVREKTTYWVDYAGPGEPPRLTPTAVIPKDPSATAVLEIESSESATNAQVAEENPASRTVHSAASGSASKASDTADSVEE